MVIPKPIEKRPMTARMFRALMHSLTPAERITFGKIVIEYLLWQPDGVYNLIKICVLNLTEEEQRDANAQIRKVKEYFQDAASAETQRELIAARRDRTEGEDADTG